ncbi:MAG: hypothetical protein Tsb008_08020 [Rhodothalassiaceae bacterium]
MGDDERIDELRKVGFARADDALTPQAAITPAREAVGSMRRILFLSLVVLGLAAVAAGALEVVVATTRKPRHTVPPSVHEDDHGQREETVGDRSVIVATGHVVPERQATVSSDEIGKITQILVREGQEVKAGQPLAYLDDVRQKLSLAEAEKNLAVARARLAEAEAARDALVPRHERIMALHARGHASRAAVDDMEAERQSLAAKVDTARRVVDLNLDLLHQAESLLEYRKIYAPFDGVVTKINAQVGEIVSPVSAGATFTRTGICTLTDRRKMYAELEVDESLLGSVAATDRAEVHVPALSRTFRALGTAIPLQIDRSKGTVRFRLELLQPTDDLLPDMTVEARLFLREG